MSSNFVVYDYGDVQLLFKLAKILKIPDIINKKTETETDTNAGMLLTLLSIAHALGRLSFPKFQFWYSYSGLEEEAYIDEGKLTSTYISRMLENISWKPSAGSKDVVGDIVYEVEQEIWKRLRKLERRKHPIYYDITSIYTYSEKLDIAFFGHPKSHDDLMQINIGLVVSSPNAFPIMHRIFAGNVTDKMTLKEISTILSKKFKTKKKMVVLDRGFDPKIALNCLRKAKFNYLMMLPFQSNEITEIATSITTEKITQAKNLVGEEYIIDIYAKLFDRKERFILGFNPKKKPNEKLARDKKINGAIKKLNKYKEVIRKGKHVDEEFINTRIKNIISGVGKYIKYSTNKNGRRISDIEFRIDNKALKKAELLDGRWMLICSDKKIPKETCVKHYRDKDLIEKSFGKFKGAIGIEPINCSRVEQANSRIFICYLSYVLLSYLRYLLKKNKTEMSVEEILMKANKIKITKSVEDGNAFSCVSTIRAKDKNITVNPIEIFSKNS
jgi:transposase